MSDWSVRNPNAGAQRMADALLRASGGYSAIFLVPAPQGDTTDAGQLGIDAPNFQSLSIAPVIFRKTRATMQENEAPRYELLVSATAVGQQVSLLQLDSADALFLLVAGVSVSGLDMVIESWASTALVGEAMLYRLLLRVATTGSVIPQNMGA